MVRLILALLALQLISIKQVYSQNLINFPKDIKRNGIKSLTVINCIDSSYCYQDYYEFGKDGLLTYEHPAMVAVYIKYAYDKNEKLKTSFSYIQSKGADRIFCKIDYFYDLKGNFKYSIQAYPESSDQIELNKIDTSYTLFSHDICRGSDIIKNKSEQIIKHAWGRLSYPCGNEYEGDHTLNYAYYKNGLISGVDIYNEENKIEISLIYNYEKW